MLLIGGSYGISKSREILHFTDSWLPTDVHILLRIIIICPFWSVIMWDPQGKLWVSKCWYETCALSMLRLFPISIKVNPWNGHFQVTWQPLAAIVPCLSLHSLWSLADLGGLGRTVEHIITIEVTASKSISDLPRFPQVSREVDAGPRELLEFHGPFYIRSHVSADGNFPLSTISQEWRLFKA